MDILKKVIGGNRSSDIIISQFFRIIFFNKIRVEDSLPNKEMPPTLREPFLRRDQRPTTE